MTRKRMDRTIAALALAATLTLGVAASGCAPKTETTPEAAKPTADAPAPTPAANVVAVTVDGSGFHPDRIAAKAGQPVTLALTRTTDETCAKEIVIASMGIDTKLPLNEKVDVTVTPGAKGEIAFACGMGMFKGTIVAD